MFLVQKMKKSKRYILVVICTSSIFEWTILLIIEKNSISESFENDLKTLKGAHKLNETDDGKKFKQKFY